MNVRSLLNPVNRHLLGAKGARFIPSLGHRPRNLKTVRQQR